MPPAAALGRVHAGHAPVTTSLQVLGPGGTSAALAGLIATARQRVLVEAFALSDTAVISALVAARRSGVDVRVMLDPQGLNSASTDRALNDAGIRTRLPNPTFGVTHLNFVAIDAGAILVLTSGLTQEALGPTGTAYLVVDNDRADVVQAAAIFYDDWLRRAVNHFGHSLVLLPDDAPSLSSLIDSAQQRIELYTSYLSDPGVIGALQNARQRGVKMRVLTPRGGNEAGLRLVGRGSGVRFRDDGGGTVLVVDRRTILLGSMDLATFSLSSHRELGVLVTSRSAVASLDRAFFSEYGRGVVLSLPPKPKPRPRRPTGQGTLDVRVDVSRVVRLGGTGVIIVTTQAAARVEIAIAYPAGSKPGNGATGTSGYALKDGSFVYRWIASGAIAPGTAVVHVRVQLGRRAASRVASFTLVR